MVHITAALQSTTWSTRLTYLRWETHKYKIGKERLAETKKITHSVKIMKSYLTVLSTTCQQVMNLNTIPVCLFNGCQIKKFFGLTTDCKKISTSSVGLVSNLTVSPVSQFYVSIKISWLFMLSRAQNVNFTRVHHAYFFVLSLHVIMMRQITAVIIM